MVKKKDKGELVAREEMQAATPFEEMDRYVETFFRNPFALLTSPLMPVSKMEGLNPSVDIYEDGNEVVVKAELPGIDKDDLNVTITENSLTISGEKKQEEKVDKKDYHRIERRYGSFTRSFRLPEAVNGDRAKASFKDGVLEVRLPRTKEARQKKIAIE